MANPWLGVRELNNRSFYEFLKCFWSEVSTEEFQGNWHIKLMCDELQDLAEKVANERSAHYKKQLEDLIINVPPGSTKTTTVMIMFPVWCWTRWYWMKFIGLSYAATLSLESAEQCRDLMYSDKFQTIYPDLQIKPDKEAKGNFTVLKEFDNQPGKAPSIKKGGGRFSTSIGGTITGFHAHIILVDDPINPEQAVSIKQLKNVNRWISQTLPTRKVHKKCSPMVMIMQRLHENDPTGHELSNRENIRHICLPAEIKNYRKDVKPPSLIENYSEDGLLDPQRLDWETIADLTAKLGQYGSAGQLGQRPTPPQGGMFKVDRFQIIDYMPQRHEFEMITRYWDKAGTEVKHNEISNASFTVGVKMAKLNNGKYLVLDVVRGQWSTENRENKMRATAEADGFNIQIGIEQEPGSGGKESAENSVTNLSGYSVKVEPPQGDKIYRADPFSVQVNHGNVLLLRADWNKAFIEEHRFFPYGTHKDQVDAASGAFRMLNRFKKAEAW